SPAGNDRHECDAQSNPRRKPFRLPYLPDARHFVEELHRQPGSCAREGKGYHAAFTLNVEAPCTGAAPAQPGDSGQGATQPHEGECCCGNSTFYADDVAGQFQCPSRQQAENKQVRNERRSIAREGHDSVWSKSSSGTRRRNQAGLTAFTTRFS